MNLLLILVGFFACMSVERVGFRKWSFVFRPGILFLLVMVALVCAGCGIDRDDSDSPTGGRSRFTPSADHLTGCQYLTFGLSGITPRMGADGKQICRKPAP